MEQHTVVKHKPETPLTEIERYESLSNSLVRLKEETDKFKKVEAKIMETEEKVSEMLKKLDFKIKYNLFLNFQKLNIATISDIEEMRVKLEPVLRSFGLPNLALNAGKFLRQTGK